MPDGAAGEDGRSTALCRYTVEIRDAGAFAIELQAVVQAHLEAMGLPSAANMPGVPSGKSPHGGHQSPGQTALARVHGGIPDRYGS